MHYNETRYQEEFLHFVEEEDLPGYLCGSSFHREVPLSYVMEGSSRGGVFMPNASVDFLEVDVMGRLHLWEAKKLHSYELTSGRVIGQLLFYDWLFRTYEREALKAKLRGAGVEIDRIAAFREDKGLKFESWNILVCGGAGYELAAGVNPIMWNYAAVMDDYFKESTPKTATYHFYHTKHGMELASIWNVSIFRPFTMETNALIAFLESEENFCYDYEIEDGQLNLYHDPDMPVYTQGEDQIMPECLFLKFIGRLHLADHLGVSTDYLDSKGS
jgi:hypothetical protein